MSPEIIFYPEVGKVRVRVRDRNGAFNVLFVAQFCYSETPTLTKCSGVGSTYRNELGLLLGAGNCFMSNGHLDNAENLQ
jgi:hypothetical protein